MSDPISAQTMVVAGSAALTVASMIWAFRVTHTERGAAAKWRERANDLETQLVRSDSIFGSTPGVILIWEDETPDAPAGWGQPRMYGSPVALASLFRFSDSSNTPDPVARILDGISDLEARDASGAETTLRRRLPELRRNGVPFSLTVIAPNGNLIEADGRTAGPRAVLWLTDATVKGIEESGARKLDEGRQLIARDPAAFLEVLSKTPYPAFRMTGGMRLEWANTAYVSAVEARTSEEAIERNLLIDSGVIEFATRALEQNQIVEEVRRVVMNGARRPVRFVLFPVSGGVAGFAFDATAEVAATEALERHTKAHDETLNHVNDAVAVYSSAKRLIFYNRAFVQLWGLEEAWLNEQPTHGAVLDRLRERRKLPQRTDFAAWRQTELSYYQDAAPELPNELWTLPDGRNVHVNRQRHPLGGLLLLFTDRTSILDLEARFRSELRVQKEALNKLKSSIAVFGPDGRLQLHNEAFKALWRLPNELNTVGISFDDLVEQCLSQMHDQTVWNAMKARITDPSASARVYFESELKFIDSRLVNFVSQPLPNGATLLAFDDVTLSKKTEGALRDRAEALESSQRKINDFVELASHHLKTPLQTIRGYGEMIESEMVGPLNDMQRNQVFAILDAANELERSVDTMLTLSKIDLEKLELSPEDVRVPQLLDEVVALLAPRARESQVKLSIDQLDEDALVSADRNHLLQVVYELVSNALRASLPDGQVTLSGIKAEGGVKILVRDQGNGIPSEKLAQVFERFVSADRTGMGLGLSAVHGVVTAHGGFVTLESVEGEGTVASVFLPRLIKVLAPDGKKIAPLSLEPAAE